MEFHCSRGSMQHHLATRWHSFTPCTCQNKPVHRTVERWTSTVWLPASVTKVAFVQLVSLCYALNATTHSKDTVEVVENTSRFILRCSGTAPWHQGHSRTERKMKEGKCPASCDPWLKSAVSNLINPTLKKFQPSMFPVIIMLTQFFMSNSVIQ